MKIDVFEEAANLEDYVQIRISFEVRQVLDVAALNNGLGGFALSERKLQAPYLKDYDAVESPLKWPQSFDMSNWGFFAARSEGVRVGGAVVAFNTAGLTLLEDRSDIVVLWDLRVSEEARGKGVGTLLFSAAMQWGAERGCRQIKIETQNINVPACKFYAKQGCTLGAIHRFAYAQFPDETQLLWYKALDPPHASSVAPL